MLILTLAPLLFSYLNSSSPGDWCTQWGFFGGVLSELMKANWQWCMGYYADGYVWGYVIAHHRIFVFAASKPELLFPLCLIYLIFQLNFHFLSEVFLDLSHTSITDSYSKRQFFSTAFTLILISHLFGIIISWMDLSHWPISAMRSGEVWVLLPHEVWNPHTLHMSI